MDENQRRIERIELKIDAISDKMAETNVILGKQHESLRLHMKRSDMLEEALKPIQRHVSMAEGALKFIGMLASAAVVFEALKAIFN